jgi:hypothetical protein
MTGHWQFEVTDTFGGEANYSWVRRAWMKDGGKPLNRRALVRRLKAFAGWTGERATTLDCGDGVEVRPARACLVGYAIWNDTDEGSGELLVE